MILSTWSLAKLCGNTQMRSRSQTLALVHMGDDNGFRQTAERGERGNALCDLGSFVSSVDERKREKSGGGDVIIVSCVRCNTQKYVHWFFFSFLFHSKGSHKFVFVFERCTH